MSVRNVLKVVMSLLLAMTIAATADTPAARGDQSPASVSAAGKWIRRIAHRECRTICTDTYTCTCDSRKPEFAECVCGLPEECTDSNKPAALLHTSGILDGLTSYGECHESCPDLCICNQRRPALAECFCSNPAEDCADSNKPAALLDTSEETPQVKGKLEHPYLIPYTECMKTCSGCACTRKWPPKSNLCICLKDDSVTKQAAAVANRLDRSFVFVTEKTHDLSEKLALLAGLVPEQTDGDDKKMVLWTTSKLEDEEISCEECFTDCKMCIIKVAASKCFCRIPMSQATGDKAVAY